MCTGYGYQHTGNGHHKQATDIQLLYAYMSSFVDPDPK